MIPTYLFCSIINVVGIFEEFSSAHTETDSVPLLTMGKLKTTKFLSVKFETLNDYFCTDIKTSFFFHRDPNLVPRNSDHSSLPQRMFLIDTLLFIEYKSKVYFLTKEENTWFQAMDKLIL